MKISFKALSLMLIILSNSQLFSASLLFDGLGKARTVYGGFVKATKIRTYVEKELQNKPLPFFLRDSVHPTFTTMRDGFQSYPIDFGLKERAIFISQEASIVSGSVYRQEIGSFVNGSAKLHH